MTNVVNMRENINGIAFSELNIGDVFESCGKLYLKYYDDCIEDAMALQIYPANNAQFRCVCRFFDSEIVSERQCTITIE